jgi:bifunctional non-homologous end joining protein LigD
MSAADKLDRYKAKRNFSITTEPADGGEHGVDALSFVIQKHWASRLHYDFRLELDGTMKSWAVPKGPSYDSHDKRMAVHVEDHPISYSSFEGTVPAKQYGAGKVIIWDRGTWHPIGDPEQGYRDGNLKFELRGHKMRGKWALIRIKSRTDKQDAWLLLKEKDAYTKSASEFSVVDEFPDSVKDLDPPMPAAAVSTTLATPTSQKRATERPRPKGSPLHPSAIKAALPNQLSPQLATLVDGPPRDPDNWVYEIKFDGYRLLARIDGASVRLFTRNGNDWTDKLTGLQAALKKAKLPPGWYDGEIVVLGDSGVPDFGALQNSFDDRKTQDIVYFLFDLPYGAGYDLRQVPLVERRAVLEAALTKVESDAIRFSSVFDAPPESVVSSACRLGLEGVIAKKRDSVYRSARSADWIKLKCSLRQEFVIGGWTDPKGGRTGFGSLLLGVYDDIGKLKYAGNVGTGFNDKTLKEIKAKLDEVPATASPFAEKTTIVGRPNWVKPRLVAEATFGEWTAAGHIRHSVFHGLRTDKPATAIIREKAASAPSPARAKAGEKAAPIEAHALSSKLRVTNPDRVIDKSTGITKIELVRYYGLVGDLMMEHLTGRPISLVRAPSGIGGQLFFQKHAETEKLSGIRQLDPALYISHPAMLEVATKEGLMSAAQWNVVEIHTLNTGTTTFVNPDRLIFDLDPGEGVTWVQVQEAAHVMHVFLGQLGLSSFLKTSGGKGLHVVVPIKKTHDWDTAKGFSQAVVVHLTKTLPQMFVAKSGPRNRIGKIFIDYLRNGLGATTVCAWSARARPGLGISVPVDWDELPKLTGGDHWSIRSVQTRLNKGNDPWKGYSTSSKTLNSAMKTLGYKA